MQDAPNRQDGVRTRDPQRTQAQILEAALGAFADHGYHGARVEAIAAAAACNPRLIYHYFGSKERLYRAVLEHIYASIREREEALNLDQRDPVGAIRTLVEFTFDFFDSDAAFVKITRNENLLAGRFISRTPEIQRMSRPLLARIDAVLERGHAGGAFARRLDPLQLYVTIVALSAHHLNSAHTLSATFGTSLTDPAWRAARRDHVVDFVLRGLGAAESPM